MLFINNDIHNNCYIHSYGNSYFRTRKFIYAFIGISLNNIKQIRGMHLISLSNTKIHDVLWTNTNDSEVIKLMVFKNES